MSSLGKRARGGIDEDHDNDGQAENPKIKVGAEYRFSSSRTRKEASLHLDCFRSMPQSVFVVAHVECAAGRGVGFV